jgi:hypothetical protein
VKYIVEVGYTGVDWADLMADMRSWLDRRQIKVDEFSHTSLGRGVAVRVGFCKEDHAAAFATSFSGRLQPRFERLVRPRASWLANDWAKIPIGLICLVLAMIITLPIPLGHVAPGTAICLLALGLMERDGVVIGIGFAAAVVALVIVSLASAGAINVVHHWFMG